MALNRVLYVLYLFVFVALVFAFAHHFYFRRLEKTVAALDTDFQKFKGIKPDVMMHLGRLNQNRSLSFLAFKKSKPRGTIRIGCFGDSYTYGTEVFDGHDYPSYLQKLFKDNGFQDVEVINFGNGWYGFHQTFMMWNFIGRFYDLDYVLLGPKSFQPHRDSRFNHAPDDAPYFIHSRYILAGDGVQLVSVPGENYREKFERYFKFIPELSIWRYDRNTPPFLKAVIGRNKDVENPFYYTRLSMTDEALETYHRLMNMMVEDDSSQFVLLHVDQAVVGVGKRIKRSNVYAEGIELPSDFPFVAQVSHMSPFGNYFVARRFFDVLTGADRIATYRIGFNLTESHEPSPNHLPLPKTEFTFTLRTSDRIIAYLESKLEPRWWLALDRNEFVSSRIVPLNLTDISNQPVYLSLANGPKGRRRKVGKVKQIRQGVPFAVIEFEGQVEQHAKELMIENGNLDQSTVLEVGGVVIAEAVWENGRFSIKTSIQDSSRFVVMPNVNGWIGPELDGNEVYLVREGSSLDKPHATSIGKLSIHTETSRYRQLPRAAQVKVRNRDDLRQL